VAKGEPFLHVSSRYPARLGCIAPVLPISRHPRFRNGVICYDLRYGPEPLLGLSVEAMRERLFTPLKDLPEGMERIPLKTIHVNHAPMVAPLATLTALAAERWGIDLSQVERHAKLLGPASDFASKVRQVHLSGEWPVETDPDLMIYAGGFFPDEDRRQMDRLRQLSPQALAQAGFNFRDPRLETMLFRYRARNWPETLSQEEREEWDTWRFQRLTNPEEGASIVLKDYQERLAALRAAFADHSDRLALISALESWSDHLLGQCPLSGCQLLASTRSV
jgi:exodeoxyribonuclease-1